MRLASAGEARGAVKAASPKGRGPVPTGGRDWFWTGPDGDAASRHCAYHGQRWCPRAGIRAAGGNPPCVMRLAAVVRADSDRARRCPPGYGPGAEMPRAESALAVLDVRLVWRLDA